MRKRFRPLALLVSLAGCAMIVMVMLLAMLGLSFRPSDIGSLEGRTLRIVGWDDGQEDAGWYCLSLPKRALTRIIDAQGLKGGDLRCPVFGSARGELMITVAFNKEKKSTSVCCWHQSAGEKWQLGRVLPLPFKDRLLSLFQNSTLVWVAAPTE